jgi:hypothetical protein
MVAPTRPDIVAHGDDESSFGLHDVLVSAARDHTPLPSCRRVVEGSDVRCA